MRGLSLFVRCDAESSAIGCNAEPNEIKIIIIVIPPINVRWLLSLRGGCLRCLRGGCLRSIVHCCSLVACVGLVFEPNESIFCEIGLKKGTNALRFPDDYYFEYLSDSML